MPANTTPIFTITPNVAKLNLTAASSPLTASDGTGTIGTNIYLLLTGASNGTYVSRIRLHAYATTPTATGATVIRFYHSTQTSGSTTPANTFLFQEVAVGAMNASNASNALTPIDVPVNWTVPSGQTILVSIHAAPSANTGWQILAIGGDY